MQSEMIIALTGTAGHPTNNQTFLNGLQFLQTVVDPLKKQRLTLSTPYPFLIQNPPDQCFIIENTPYICIPF
ncbi:hypothetical protein GCM10007103_07690 [Salinimicrobium marinum]|uniref:Uncharacterized protein n=1 Tax=Salinimicrobium marinum TaxID=680283 RepID=A0A918S9X9_9FLAO|nr:hypothetical protein GCM10007103_07690 [Salinimicrobium marinum]